MKTIMLMGLLLLSGAAHASRGLGHWQGTGVVILPGGQQASEFTVELTRAAIDEHTVDVAGKVTLVDGRTIPVTERQVLDGDAWTSESPRGKGVGRCFGGGLCQGYEESGEGKARSITIVLDGENQMRVLITELENGRATRFIRQTLTRTK